MRWNNWAFEDKTNFSVRETFRCFSSAYCRQGSRRQAGDRPETWPGGSNGRPPRWRQHMGWRHRFGFSVCLNKSSFCLCLRSLPFLSFPPLCCLSFRPLSFRPLFLFLSVYSPFILSFLFAKWTTEPGICGLLPSYFNMNFLFMCNLS